MLLPVVAAVHGGQQLGQVVTRREEAATLDLMWGAAIELEIAGGMPERSTLEDTALTFDAVEGRRGARCEQCGAIVVRTGKGAA